MRSLLGSRGAFVIWYSGREWMHLTIKGLVGGGLLEFGWLCGVGWDYVVFWRSMRRSARLCGIWGRFAAISRVMLSFGEVCGECEVKDRLRASLLLALKRSFSWMVDFASWLFILGSSPLRFRLRAFRP